MSVQSSLRFFYFIMENTIVTYKRTFDYQVETENFYIIKEILIEGSTAYLGRMESTGKLHIIYPAQIIDIISQRKIAK